jgi:hypothetical protein
MTQALFNCVSSSHSDISFFDEEDSAASTGCTVMYCTEYAGNKTVLFGHFLRSLYVMRCYYFFLLLVVLDCGIVSVAQITATRMYNTSSVLSVNYQVQK